MAISSEAFGATSDGTQVELWTLTNLHGMQARIMTYGGTLVSLLVPDRDGVLGDVVIGYDTLEPYLTVDTFFGALIGRYGNRIAHGRFSLNGQHYTLATNNGANHLHGGTKGFDKVVWSAEPNDDADMPALTLRYHSPDGEEGYPGNLDVAVTYTITPENALQISYTATTDSDTLVNLTNHAYFNLAGHGDILSHELHVFADTYLPVDETLIPLGESQPVGGTPMDFTEPRVIGTGIALDDEQLRRGGGGYDHNWVLNSGGGVVPALVGHLYDPESGRVMDILTTEPGMQLFSGNFSTSYPGGKNGQTYERYAALCLETQHFPDSPNHPTYPSTVLRAGETYHSETIYRFRVK